MPNGSTSKEFHGIGHTVSGKSNVVLLFSIFSPLLNRVLTCMLGSESAPTMLYASKIAFFVSSLLAAASCEKRGPTLISIRCAGRGGGGGQGGG